MRKFVALSVGLGLGDVVQAANPIRRVVTLLEEMQKEIETEVAKEKEIMKKFECYCKKNDKELGKKVEEAAALVKKAQAEAKQYGDEKKKLGEEIKQHKADRKKSKGELEAATNKRVEEKKVYDAATKEVQKTLADIDRAVQALEKGMGKSFLQTKEADYLRQVVEANGAAMQQLGYEDERKIQFFLQSGKDYAPQSGEIVGILKAMKDQFDDNLGGVVKAEESAVKAYEKMKTALQTIIKASGAAIEKKSERKGEVAVLSVEAANLASNTEKQMGDDMASAAQLKDACANKGGEFEARQKDAADEVEAIGQAIAVLDNDDALELMNKTSVRAKQNAAKAQATEFVQVAMSSRISALEKIAKATKSAQVSLIASRAAAMLKAGAVDFSPILKMIDDMVGLMKQEQEADTASREQCNTDLRDVADALKETAHSIAKYEGQVEDYTAQVKEQDQVIADKQAEQAEAKKQQAEATEQRSVAHEAYVVARDLNMQAVALIQKAKDKLNSYYNPQLVTTTQAPALSAEEQIAAGAQTVLIQAHVQQKEKEKDLPAGAPETWEAGERKNKGQKGASVLALMDMLAGELNKDTDKMTHDEETQQKDYVKLSEDLARQTADAQTAEEQAESAKAAASAGLSEASTNLQVAQDDLSGHQKTQTDLHASCDFIIANYEERKAKRTTEQEGLIQAKAVLQGAKLG